MSTDARKKDVPFFSHDANARNDLRIASMRLKYGWQGYGWYWAVIEMLREAADYKLPRKGYLYDGLAHQLNSSGIEIKQFIDDCIESFELFSTDGDSFWSERLNRTMAYVAEKSQQARERAKKRWGDPNTAPAPSEGLKTKGSGPKTKPKAEGQGKFSPPTLEEVKAYFSEWEAPDGAKSRQPDRDASKFHSYYESKNWLVGRTKMKDWKAAARGWILRSNDNLTSATDINHDQGF